MKGTQLNAANAENTRKMGDVRDGLQKRATVRRDTVAKCVREGWASLVIQTKDGAYSDHIRSAKRNAECPKEVPNEDVLSFLDRGSVKCEVLLEETGIEGGQVVKVWSGDIRADFKRFRIEMNPDKIVFE